MELPTITLSKADRRLVLAILTIAATTFLAAIGTVSGDAALALISAAGGAGAGYQTGKKTERRKNSDGGTENP